MKFIVVLHTDDGGRFDVTVAALAGCFSGGVSPDDALESVREAIDLHVVPLEPVAWVRVAAFSAWRILKVHQPLPCAIKSTSGIPQGRCVGRRSAQGCALAERCTDSPRMPSLASRGRLQRSGCRCRIHPCTCRPWH